MATGGIALNGTTQYLELSSAVVTAYPFSLVIWANTTTNQNSFPLTQCQSNADRAAFIFFDTNGITQYASLRNPGNTDSASIGGAQSSSSLKLALAVFTSASSRKIYFDSSTGGTSTVSMTDDVSNYDRVTIGGLHYNSSAASFLHAGVVAEAHIFNTALTSSDFTTLLTTPAENVAGWVDGWTLADNTTLTSIGGSRTLTAVGSPSNGAATLPYTRGDTTAPVLSSPTGTQTGSSTASGTVSSANDANGTLYYYASTNATETAATVKASGATQAVTATGAQSVAFTGLSPSTTYYAHYVHRDAAGNDSNAVDSASFTTTASGGLTTRSGSRSARFSFGSFTR